MMKSLLTLSLVLCFAVCVWAGCCTPDQWEGYQPSSAGYSARHRKGQMKEFAKVSYDFTNKRKALFMTLIDRDKEKKFQIVTRYGDDMNEEEGTIYVVDLKENKCWTKKTEREFRKACIPDKSKVAGHGYLGLEGKGLKITAYEIATREVDAMVTVNNLDENTCVPVGEVVSGEMRRKRVSFMRNVAFIDITPGIKNETIFDIPKQCEENLDTTLEAELERDFIMAV